MVVQEQQRLTRVEALLRQIEQEGVMPTQEVVIKRVEPMRVASLRDVIPTFDAQGSLWQELGAFWGPEPNPQPGSPRSSSPCSKRKKKKTTPRIVLPSSGWFLTDRKGYTTSKPRRPEG